MLINQMKQMQTREISSVVDAANQGRRLDHWLTLRFTYRSRHQWQNLIKSGDILINGSVTRSSRILQTGDKVSFVQNSVEPSVQMEYEIVFEDDWLLTINKCGHLPCHPAGPFFRNTLWYDLCQKFGKIHIVNRLDRETSGLLIIAKDEKVAAAMMGAAQSGIIHKEYYAVVYGEFSRQINASGWLINDSASPVLKKRRFVSSVVPDTECESASTYFEPILCRSGLSLIKATPITGRMHQIRATLFSLGFPLAGDKLYGPDDRIYLKIAENKITPEDWQQLIFTRQALHSCYLSFPHPVTGLKHEYYAKLPGDIDIELLS
jgi:23S rRNA pseudouridine955/2504/2580 synthase/23S rRNA pseudouridine1911/1915/1917 synthase